MRIYISSAFEDLYISNEISLALIKQGHKVISGRSIVYDIEESLPILQQCDVILAIITESYLNSPSTMAELSSSVIGTYIANILPVVIGNVFLPAFLDVVNIVKVATPEDAISNILEKIQSICAKNEVATSGKQDTTWVNVARENTSKTNNSDSNDKIKLLNEALIDNQLTLVCGAGISVSSGIPTWNDLLVDILNDTFFSESSKNAIESKVSAQELLSIMPQSNLILGKYLRLVLKDSFDKVVRSHLYHFSMCATNSATKPIAQNIETDIVKAIIELARPKRRGKCLESIITFNFDDLIETALSQHSIEHCSIWKEGQEREIDALPIYHVHGYLPSRREISDPNLVFSEETYHSQFIDPYSWSNLIQLNTFSANVCLFVGISLSDPNLRRLLDISWRKNNRCKHYIIMKKSLEKNRTTEITNMLFEQDANSLGLNVIWCSDFSEIPHILKQISKFHS